MILGKNYIPIIKTGESELKALKNIDENIKKIMLPLFELTRGRKNPKAEEGLLEASINFLRENFLKYPFILDLTLDDKLTNSEIRNLFSSKDNYNNWVSFCLNQQKDFVDIIPVVQMVEENDYNIYLQKLKNQVEMLGKNFKYIVFRAHNESVAKNIILDINNILKENRLEFLRNKIIFIFDFKYINDIQKGTELTQQIIKVLHKLGIFNIVISSTSFPENVSDHMSMNDFVKFKIKEIEFFKNCTQGINGVIYSDYATVNPVRNDNAVFAKGWIPRIDVPALDDYIYCRRKRRNKDATYADAYIEISQKVINSDYFNDLILNKYSCWGLDEIIKTSKGIVGGSTPRFWISVRINIYLHIIEQILNKVYQ